jgi:Spy/CpxP family protein refolding chaperone
MKFGVKGFAALLSSIAIMSAMAATPASACHWKRGYHGHHHHHCGHHRHHHRCGW